MFYVKNVCGIEVFCVGFLNNGMEEIKGDFFYKEVYELLVVEFFINFIGNIEVCDLMLSVVDVVVIDGFIGNVVLKIMEGIVMSIMGSLKFLIKLGGVKVKLGVFLLKDSLY